MSDLMEYSGPWAGTRQVCNFLGISPSELALRTSNRELLGRTFTDGNVYYPTRQFIDGQIVDGLPAVLDVLSAADADPDAWIIWLSGNAGERATIWELLRAGQVEAVLTRARRHVGS